MAKRKAARKPKATPQAEEAAAQAEVPADKPQGEPEEAVNEASGEVEAQEAQEASDEPPEDLNGGDDEPNDDQGEDDSRELPSANEALLKRIAELEARNASLEAEKAEAAKKESAPAPSHKERGPSILTSADLQLSGKPKEPEPQELTKAQRHWRTAEAGVMKRRGTDLGPQSRKVYAVRNQDPRNSEISLEDGTIYVAEFKMTSDAAIPVAMVPQVVYEQMEKLFRGRGNYAFENEV